MKTNKAQIKFFYNWNNKLACNCFTTIRLFNPEKYKVNTCYEIFLKDKKLFEGTIIDIRNFTMSAMSPFVAMLDTGYGVEECKKIMHKMYPAAKENFTMFSLILIQKIDPKHEVK